MEHEELTDYGSVGRYYVIARPGSPGHFASEDAIWLFYDNGIWYDELLPDMLFLEEELDVLENEILPKAKESTSDIDVKIYSVPVKIGKL